MHVVFELVYVGVSSAGHSVFAVVPSDVENDGPRGPVCGLACRHCGLVWPFGYPKELRKGVDVEEPSEVFFSASLKHVV